MTTVVPSPAIPPDEFGDTTVAFRDESNIETKPAPVGAGTSRSEVKTVTMSVTNATPWVTQYVAVTATTEVDVGPTPYYIMIFQDGRRVASSGSGTTCGVTAVVNSEASHTYRACVGSLSDTWPPPNLQAQSEETQIRWGIWIVLKGLTFSKTTAAPGEPVLVTLQASGGDVGPSPFYLTIYDTTTGARLGYTGSGASCQATVTEAAASTHRYVGYLSNLSAGCPPSQVWRATRPGFVTWSSAGFTLSAVGYPASPAINATASKAIYPYCISVFNIVSNRLVATAHEGDAASLPHPRAGQFYVAFVGDPSSTCPPPNPQAASAEVRSRPMINVEEDTDGE